MMALANKPDAAVESDDDDVPLGLRTNSSKPKKNARPDEDIEDDGDIPVSELQSRIRSTESKHGGKKKQGKGQATSRAESPVRGRVRPVTMDASTFPADADAVPPESK
jgi:hypothetical protein